MKEKAGAAVTTMSTPPPSSDTAPSAATIRALRSNAGLVVGIKKGAAALALRSSDMFGHRSLSRGSATPNELGLGANRSLTPIFKRI